MGTVIIDIRGGLQFKGPILKLEKAIASLVRLQKDVRPNRLMIGTIPVPDKLSIVVEIRFKGPISEFENVILGLEKLRESVPFNTVPLPAIGTWPTPEYPFGWTMGAKVQ